MRKLRLTENKLFAHIQFKFKSMINCVSIIICAQPLCLSTLDTFLKLSIPYILSHIPYNLGKITLCFNLVFPTSKSCSRIIFRLFEVKHYHYSLWHGKHLVEYMLQKISRMIKAYFYTHKCLAFPTCKNLNTKTTGNPFKHSWQKKKKKSQGNPHQHNHVLLMEETTKGGLAILCQDQRFL